MPVRKHTLQRTDVDLHVVAEEVTRQTLHLLGPGGGPHKNLTIRPDVIEDLADLRLEAHVQHAIGLVQHQVRYPLQGRGAGLEEIDQPTGRGDHDLDAAAQVRRLRSLARATEQARVANVRRRAELGRDLLDLLRQLAGRGQHEHQRSAHGRVRLLLREERMVERLQQRDAILRIVLEHLRDQIKHLHVLWRIGHGAAHQRLAVLQHVPRLGRFLVPVELAVREVSGRRFLRHVVRYRAEYALHHGEVFPVVVRLEQRDTQVQFVDDATDRPHVARLRPAQLEYHLRRPVVPRRDDRAVVLVIEDGVAEIDQPNVATVDVAQLAVLPRRPADDCVVLGVYEQYVLRLQVRVRELDAVQKVDRKAQLVGHVPDLLHREWLVLIVFHEVVHALAEHLERDADVPVVVEPVQHQDAQVPAGRIFGNDLLQHIDLQLGRLAILVHIAYDLQRDRVLLLHVLRLHDAPERTFT
uniref:Uncharacterized protein n=1 Tax=Anopheles coluzzii TaxID=1518534 RepID=A0A8W7PAS2_ANOCL